MKRTGCHVPNALGARDEWGRMVCARCGQPYDAVPRSARTAALDEAAEPSRSDGSGAR